MLKFHRKEEGKRNRTKGKKGEIAREEGKVRERNKEEKVKGQSRVA